MPEILRAEGLRIVIYPADHRPAHVHVLGPGWTVVVTLDGPAIRVIIGCGAREARRALALMITNKELLKTAWSRIHG